MTKAKWDYTASIAEWEQANGKVFADLSKKEQSNKKSVFRRKMAWKANPELERAKHNQRRKEKKIRDSIGKDKKKTNIDAELRLLKSFLPNRLLANPRRAVAKIDLISLQKVMDDELDRQLKQRKANVFERRLWEDIKENYKGNFDEDKFWYEFEGQTYLRDGKDLVLIVAETPGEIKTVSRNFFELI